jgi:hypothetical protein
MARQGGIMRYSMTSERFERIFGGLDHLDGSGPGRSRLCRTCGGWHRTDRPWPHNCRKPAPPRNPNLAAPQIAPAFTELCTDVPGYEVLPTKRAMRDFLDRHDRIPWEPGLGDRTPEWVEEYDRQRDIVSDIKKSIEMDPLAIPPDMKALPMNPDGSLADGTEIETNGIDIAGGGE